jgi:hypothetical protein
LNDTEYIRYSALSLAFREEKKTKHGALSECYTLPHTLLLFFFFFLDESPGNAYSNGRTEKRNIYVPTRQFYWPTFSSIKAKKEHGGGGKEEKKLYK